MRLSMTTIALASLAACGDNSAGSNPERQSAAGEVLGGEVSDEMLPLDTVRSTSPAGPSDPAEKTGGAGEPTPDSATPTPSPRPTLTAAPMPDMTMPADPEPLRSEE